MRGGSALGQATSASTSTRRSPGFRQRLACRHCRLRPSTSSIPCWMTRRYTCRCACNPATFSLSSEYLTRNRNHSATILASATADQTVAPYAATIVCSTIDVLFTITNLQPLNATSSGSGSPHLAIDRYRQASRKGSVRWRWVIAVGSSAQGLSRL